MFDLSFLFHISYSWTGGDVGCTCLLTDVNDLCNLNRILSTKKPTPSVKEMILTATSSCVLRSLALYTAPYEPFPALPN